MEGKTNFWRRLKHFDDLTWLILTTQVLRQAYASGSVATAVGGLTKLGVSVDITQQSSGNRQKVRTDNKRSAADAVSTELISESEICDSTVGKIEIS